MAKFHVNSKGEPGSCSASVGSCPFGGDEAHYESAEAAYEALASSNQLVVTLKKGLKADFVDAEGNSTSREEMLQAIQDLGTNGRKSNYPEYKRMSESFWKIERKNKGLSSSRLGGSRKAYLADVELTDKVHHAISYHYVDPANVALVARVKDELAKPFDENDPYAVHRNIAREIYKFYDKNPAASLRSRTGDPYKTAYAILHGLGRSEEISWKRF